MGAINRLSLLVLVHPMARGLPRPRRFPEPFFEVKRREKKLGNQKLSGGSGGSLGCVVNLIFSGTNEKEHIRIDVIAYRRTEPSHMAKLEPTGCEEPKES